MLYGQRVRCVKCDSYRGCHHISCTGGWDSVGELTLIKPVSYLKGVCDEFVRVG